eukprot:4125846-Prorocentrum_lima.AAC.1
MLAWFLVVWSTPFVGLVLLGCGPQLASLEFRSPFESPSHPGPSPLFEWFCIVVLGDPFPC